MWKRNLAVAALMAAAMVSAMFAGSTTTQQSPAANQPAAQAPDAEALRLQGEERFRTNCGRCHQTPHKFPPRMMATIIRHMRVRATLTDEDMKLILRYMTQ